MIVWMASYPRSGNTLLFQAIQALYGLQPRTVYKAPCTYDYNNLGDTPGEINFIKTHFTGTHAHSPWPAIVLVRDGRAAVARYAHYHRKHNVDRRPADEIMKDLATGELFPSGWDDFYHHWTHREAPFTILYFESMVYDLGFYVAEAVRRLGLGLTPKPNPILPQIRPLDLVLGDHMKQMQGKPLAAFWKHNGRMMRELGYSVQPPNSTTAGSI